MSQRARHRRQPVTSGQTAAPRSDVHTRHVAVSGLTGPDPRRPPDASVTPRRLRPRPIPSRRPLLLPVAVAPGGGMRSTRCACCLACSWKAPRPWTCAARQGPGPVAVASRGSGPPVKSSGRRGPPRSLAETVRGAATSGGHREGKGSPPFLVSGRKFLCRSRVPRRQEIQSWKRGRRDRGPISPVRSAPLPPHSFSVGGFYFRASTNNHGKVRETHV